MANKEENKEEKINTGKKDENKDQENEEEEQQVVPLDQEDIKLLMRYGKGPYFDKVKKIEEELKEYTDKIIKLSGIK